MFSTLTTINGYNPTKALFLKEFWDNRRAILTTPMVVTGLFIVFSLLALMSSGGSMEIDGTSLNDHLANAHEFKARSGDIITGILIASPMILIISMAFSMVFTSLSVLFDERKDKSILFWKSMPVSDTQEVLVKLASVVIVTPLIALGFAVIIQIFTALMLGLIVTFGTDYGAWDIIFSNISPFTILAANIVPTFVFILWTLPIFAWFMLVSSFSKRSPFLLAFLIPVLGIALEEIFFGSSMIMHSIGSRFSYLEKYGNRFDIDKGNLFEGVTSLLGSLGEPNFWIGTLAAAAMIAACIQIRKRNSIT